MIVRDPKTDEYLGIKCDRCERMAPSTAEISRAHGLNRLGWSCSGGSHICPDHLYGSKRHG